MSTAKPRKIVANKRSFDEESSALNSHSPSENGLLGPVHGLNDFEDTGLQEEAYKKLQEISQNTDLQLLQGPFEELHKLLMPHIGETWRDFNGLAHPIGLAWTHLENLKTIGKPTPSQVRAFKQAMYQKFGEVQIEEYCENSAYVDEVLRQDYCPGLRNRWAVDLEEFLGPEHRPPLWTPDIIKGLAELSHFVSAEKAREALEAIIDSRIFDFDDEKNVAAKERKRCLLASDVQCILSRYKPRNSARKRADIEQGTVDERKTRITPPRKRVRNPVAGRGAWINHEDNESDELSRSAKRPQLSIRTNPDAVIATTTDTALDQQFDNKQVANSGKVRDQSRKDYESVPITLDKPAAPLPHSDVDSALQSFQPGKKLTSTAIQLALNVWNSEEVWVLDHTALNVDQPRWAPLKGLRETHQYIVLPLHQSNISHWTLALFDLRAKVFRHYDSLGNNEAWDTKVKSLSQRFLEERLLKTSKGWLFNCFMFQPLQHNDFDCGIYAVVSAFYLLCQRPPTENYDASIWRYVLLDLILRLESHVPFPGWNADKFCLLLPERPEKGWSVAPHDDCDAILNTLDFEEQQLKVATAKAAPLTQAHKIFETLKARAQTVLDPFDADVATHQKTLSRLNDSKANLLADGVSPGAIADVVSVINERITQIMTQVQIAKGKRKNVAHRFESVTIISEGIGSAEKRYMEVMHERVASARSQIQEAEKRARAQIKAHQSDIKRIQERLKRNSQNQQR